MLLPQMRFRVALAVRNRNSGNGSIDKPILKLHFSIDGDGFEIQPYPKGANAVGQYAIDLDPTIPVPGGGMTRVAIDYWMPLTPKLEEHFTKNIADLRCVLHYSDNMGHQYSLPIGLQA